ncbi:MAG: hypothetical protein AAF840_03200, partial [Bacteroidota bacterium]
MLRGALLWIILCGSFGMLMAQNTGLRTQRIAVSPPAQSIDSLVVVPQSLRIVDLRDGNDLSPSDYQFNFQKLYWLGTNLPDSVQVYYRCFPSAFRLSSQLLDTTLLRQEASVYDDILIENPLLEEIFREERTLNYQGSFSRGLSFGNNQDLVLNSRFNLQMAGQLSNGMEIKAAITDENIPLQAAGNTQQLREFDRIFVQLTKDKTTLTAGDYELRKPTGYFMNYLKKLQGATLEREQRIGENGVLRAQLSGAVARGKFARNLIPVQEGNQGPYQLQGADGELFIIVLSGTEKVWVDGQLMQRGLEYDYIIDYNLGELTFTQQRLITKDSRVVVEFDYSVQNYLRSLYAINTQYEQGRFRAYFNVYSEQDSRNSTGARPLTEAEREALRQAGDDPLRAVVSSRDTFETFDPSRVYYRLADTLTECGQIDSVLVYSPSESTADVIATFTLVGPGNGDYILDNEQFVNQRVFRYVAPDPETCTPQGDYAPIRQLGAPQQWQLYTLGADYQIGKTGQVRAELGISRRDFNRFSSIDDDDNDGYALRLDWSQPFRLGRDSAWTLEPFVNYEGVQARFRTLNPYRNPDFLRDWNLTDVNGIGTVAVAEEQLAGGGFRLRQKNHDLRYELQSFTRDSLYDGQRQELAASGRWNKLQYELGASLLNSEGSELRTRFWRPSFLVRQELGFLNNWAVSVKGQREKSDRFLLGSDTLTETSFFFDRYGVALESPTAQAWKFRLAYEERVDYETQGINYVRGTTAQEWIASGERQWQLPQRGRLQLTGNLTHRR